MEEFTKLNLFEKRKLAIEKLVKYESELRKYNFSKGSELKCIKLRKKIYFIIKMILKIDQILSKEKIVILKDLHNNTNNKPRIYACTHIGGNDIQRAFQVMKEQGYLMLGDPGILYRKSIYKALQMNGVIPLETKDKEDRKIAYKRSVELLSNGGTLLIYPEGAWNISPNLLVMKLFNGVVRMAKETGAEIIPIAMEQYGKTFYFNIGKNYTISKDTSKSEKELTNELRDTLATLKWDILESQSKLDNSIIYNEYLDIFQKEIIDRCNYGYGFSLDDALSESYHDKNISTYLEVFKPLENMEINKNNAFLIKEKIEYEKTKKIRSTVI